MLLLSLESFHIFEEATLASEMQRWEKGKFWKRSVSKMAYSVNHLSYGAGDNML